MRAYMYNLEKVVSRLCHVRDIINHEKAQDAESVTVRNITIISKGTSLDNQLQGETDPTLVRAANVSVRLAHHIEFIAEIANKAHEQHYTQLGKIKSGCLNKITRISLPEFSLYTASPLSKAEFNKLVEEIRKIAAKCYDNVHLLLGTFAVLHENSEVLNLCLYVECGHDPKFHVLCKYNKSDIDITYPGHRICQQYSETYETSHTPYSASALEQSILSNDPVFCVTTRGGVNFFVAIDICAETYIQRTQTVLKDYGFRLHGFCPNKIDQILVSNSCHKLFTDVVTKNQKLVHIDPYTEKYKGRSDYDNHSALGTRVEPLQITSSTTQTTYPELELSTSPDSTTLIVKNAPFGTGDFGIIQYPEQELVGFSPVFEKIIDEENINHVQSLLDLYLPKPTSDLEKQNRDMLIRNARYVIPLVNFLVASLKFLDLELFTIFCQQLPYIECILSRMGILQMSEDGFLTKESFKAMLLHSNALATISIDLKSCVTSEIVTMIWQNIDQLELIGDMIAEMCSYDTLTTENVKDMLLHIQKIRDDSGSEAGLPIPNF